jgi:hypothetical protein
VFVQAFEPRDAAFITNLGSNLVVVPTSTNWWIDHRPFRPLPGVTKDVDVVMVAGWGEYKRHHRFFAALPCVLREGFNYGYRYPYINEQTGCFARERDLPEKLLWMIERHDQLSPREWVAEHMSAQRATQLLAEAIGKTAAGCGEGWSGNVAVKVNKLHGMEYWDANDRRHFETDYAFLRSARKG